MPIAALLDPLVNLCTDFIGSVGYAGVFVLTMLGSACIPIPSEATMMFAGFKVSDGDLTLFGVAEMPLRRFIPLTLAGSLIWLSGLTLIGRAVGDNWDKWHQRLAFLDYLV